MDSFGTYQGAYEIFRNVNWIGARENCIIGAVVDQSKSSSFTASMVGYGALGPAGELVGEVIGRERDERVSHIYDYLFVLMNLTENGVGIMPVRGSGLRLCPEKQGPVYEGFVFYYYQELAEISVKNYFGIRKSVKTIMIKLADGNKLYFTANMVEKPMPYQENGMKLLVSRYQK